MATVELPSLQELNVQEVNVSSAVLKAAAHHYGSQCDKPNKEFMLCRWEEKDPRKCLQEGKKVNECALDFFRYSSHTELGADRLPLLSITAFIHGLDFLPPSLHAIRAQLLKRRPDRARVLVIVDSMTQPLRRTELATIVTFLYFRHLSNHRLFRENRIDAWKYFSPRKIKTHCSEPFTEYWTCLDYSNLQEFRRCRKQQDAFDNCVLDKLGWVRPDLGELSKLLPVFLSIFGMLFLSSFVKTEPKYES
eukprot:g43799.t1